MTEPLDVEGLKRVAEAFSKDDVSAFGAQLPRFTPAFVLNLLARIEEVEGENRRLQTEVLNAAFSDRLDMEAGGSPLTWKEIALSAEAVLVSLKGEQDSLHVPTLNFALEIMRRHMAEGQKKDRRSDLIRAGALIVAEIERLDRLVAPSNNPKGEG